MFELQILIPVKSNEGELFTATQHQQFERELINLFGGFSLYPNEVTGAWADAGEIYYDQTRAYALAVRSITDGSKVQSTVDFAKSHYGQLAIFVRYLGINEIL